MDWCDVVYIGVEYWCEEEVVVGVGVDFDEWVGCDSIDDWSMGFYVVNKVCVVWFGSVCMIVMFWDEKECWGNDRGCGVDVEGVVRIIVSVNNVILSIF